MKFSLDFDAKEPLYLQIRNAIIVGVANGELKPGEEIPSVRGLARDIGINHMTVAKAYQLLKKEGVIQTDPRRKTYIAESVSKEDRSFQDQYYEQLELALSEGYAKGLSKKELFAFVEKILNNL